ncbi:MAG: hypothetical protein LBI53_05715 [Candidatus Peribacteria bacterium]|jgi:hypothetical protein|nr:hypothetical protein [Candidatus Peribacteria bacterium]
MKNEYANTNISGKKVRKEKMEWWIPLGCFLLGIVLLGIVVGYVIGIIAFIILDPIERYQERKNKFLILRKNHLNTSL